MIELHILAYRVPGGGREAFEATASFVRDSIGNASIYRLWSPGGYIIAAVTSGEEDAKRLREHLEGLGGSPASLEDAIAYALAFRSVEHSQQKGFRIRRSVNLGLVNLGEIVMEVELEWPE